MLRADNLFPNFFGFRFFPTLWLPFRVNNGETLGKNHFVKFQLLTLFPFFFPDGNKKTWTVQQKPQYAASPARLFTFLVFSS